MQVQVLSSPYGFDEHGAASFGSDGNALAAGADGEGGAWLPGSGPGSRLRLPDGTTHRPSRPRAAGLLSACPARSPGRANPRVESPRADSFGRAGERL